MRKLWLILLGLGLLSLSSCFVFVPYRTGVDEKPLIPSVTPAILESPTATIEAIESPIPVSTATPEEEIIIKETTAIMTVTTVPTGESKPSPSPSPTPFIPPVDQIPGIEMHNIDERGGLNLVKQAGAYWVRRNALFWSLVEPVPADRRWENLASLEGELKNSSEAGLKTVLVVRRTPYWAQKIKGNYCGPIAEEALDEFANFMYDLVSRYSQPPYNVYYWEIGNEPDVDPRLVSGDEIYGCWGDENDEYYGGGYYAEVLKAVYPKIKSANAQAQVLVGGLLLDCDPTNPPESPAGSGKYKDCTSSLFLEGILKNGGGDSFDGVSYHAYDYYWGAEGAYKNTNWNSSSDVNGPVLIPKAEYLKSVLDKYGYPEKYLMNSEAGLVCGRTGDESYCRTEIFQATKAYFVAQANAAARAQGLRGNIWYSIYGWRSSGLARTSQIGYPALQAFQVSAKELMDTGFVAELHDYPGLLGYSFQRSNGFLWILWASDGKKHDITLPDDPVGIFDVFGNSLVTSNQVTIGSAPVYIEFNK
jgi:hypothetical protein